MKRLTLLIAISVSFLLSTCDIVYAGRPTPSVDTLSLNSLGGIERFVAGWKIGATTTPDTLVPPKAGSYFLIINHGAIGDTVKVSCARQGRKTNFSTEVIGGHDGISLDIGENLINQLVVKSVSGTVAIEILIKR